MCCNIPKLTRMLLLCSLLVPTGAFATDFEISQLATEIRHASERLALGLRYSNGYGSVRHSASRLSSEADQLLRAVSYNRSSSVIRAEFRDIARRYQDLEQDYLRANRSGYNALAYAEMDNLSYLFTSLSNVIYYGQRTAPVYGGYNYVPPVASYQPYSNRGVRPLRQVAPGGHARPGVGQEDKGRINRFEYGRRSIGASNNFDHSSPVLQRQQRNLGNGLPGGASRNR